MPIYPEHEKLEQLKDQVEAVGEFLDWLFESKGYYIAEHRQYWNNGMPPYINRQTGEPCSGSILNLDGDCVPNAEYDYVETGYYPIMQPVDKWLMEFFEIDAQKIEAEKREMLLALRGATVSATQ